MFPYKSKSVRKYIHQLEIPISQMYFMIIFLKRKSFRWRSIFWENLRWERLSDFLSGACTYWQPHYSPDVYSLIFYGILPRHMWKWVFCNDCKKALFRTLLSCFRLSLQGKGWWIFWICAVNYLLKWRIWFQICFWKEGQKLIVCPGMGLGNHWPFILCDSYLYAECNLVFVNRTLQTCNK